ncbi:MAG: hypothetical protein RL577_590 [Bacteroidota bacterium]|jgi:hypothetical protein
MNRPERQTVLNIIEARIQARLDDLHSAIRIAQESRNGEEKSSAGDKYETGRAMVQIELENLGKQLALVEKQLMDLRRWNKKPESTAVVGGHLLHLASKPSLFLGPSLGLIQAEGINFMTVSVSAPLGQCLLGMKAGESRRFNAVEYQLEELA